MKKSHQMKVFLLALMCLVIEISNYMKLENEEFINISSDKYFTLLKILQ